MHVLKILQKNLENCQIALTCIMEKEKKFWFTKVNYWKCVGKVHSAAHKIEKFPIKSFIIVCLSKCSTCSEAKSCGAQFVELRKKVQGDVLCHSYAATWLFYEYYITSSPKKFQLLPEHSQRTKPGVGNVYIFCLLSLFFAKFAGQPDN